MPTAIAILNTVLRWNAARQRLALTSRNALAEWVVTVLILVFTTTTLAQAFVIPSSSMEDTLMTGDHVLVDKLSYSPAGPLSRHLQDRLSGSSLNPDHPKDLAFNFFSKTRWNRSFQLVRGYPL